MVQLVDGQIARNILNIILFFINYNVGKAELVCCTCIICKDSDSIFVTGK